MDVQKHTLFGEPYKAVPRIPDELPGPSSEPVKFAFMSPLQSSSDVDPGDYIENFLQSQLGEEDTIKDDNPKARKRKKRKTWSPRKPKKGKTTGTPPDPCTSGEVKSPPKGPPQTSNTAAIPKRRSGVLYSDSESDAQTVAVNQTDPQIESNKEMGGTTSSHIAPEDPPNLVPESESVVVTTDVGETEQPLQKGDSKQVSQERMMSAADGLDAEKALDLAAERGLTDDEAEEFHQTSSKRSKELSVSSRTLIREFFSSNPVVTLPTGHATVAFTEAQVGAIVQAVSRETSVTSFATMKDLLLKASNFRPLVENKPKPSDKFRRSVPLSDCNSSSGDESNVATVKAARPQVVRHKQPQVKCVTDTSSGENSDPDTRTTPTAVRKVTDHGSRGREPDTSSGDDVTLSSYRSRERPNQAPSSFPRRRQNPGRPGKMMNESCLRGQERTGAFATGPVDPEYNQFRFYCQICKYNVSMYSKGKGELRRHYRRESHLRKDQRWRYENLQQITPVTKVETPLVRDKTGVLLKGAAWQAELPFFMDEELVDIGPKYPFYEDYILGRDPSQTSAESKASVQLSLFGRFLQGGSRLSFLRSFWNNVGVLLNHQSTFSDIDFSDGFFSVSSSIHSSRY